MNLPQPDASLRVLDRLGARMARQLDDQATPLPHDVRERLRVARQQALAAQKESRPAPRLLTQGDGTLGLAGPGFDRMAPWRWLAALIPVLVLLAGLDLLLTQAQDQGISEIAHIDAQMLSDDIPPAAYADPGFIQFMLEARRQQAHDD